MPDRLEHYRKKRNFHETAEPVGQLLASSKRTAEKGGIFVIHKHDARRLHYDLRLEHDGVLWSWAVTRGPSLDPSEKRLAVHVEDHPIDYASFEGNIPKGSYGAGSVIVWDQGRWKPEGDATAGLKKGHLSFELAGTKLKGLWHLVRLKGREKEKRDNWLLIKSDDEYADKRTDILETAPNSAKSKLSNEDIASGKTRKKPAKDAKPTGKQTASPLPPFVIPALATLKAAPPSGSDWLHEVKFDGYRIQAHISGGKVKLYTRSGLDWTSRFGRHVTEELLGLDAKQAIIDGEMVVLSPNGVASFSLLQSDLSEGRIDRLVFYAFDLLHLDDVSWIGEPLAARKTQLERLLAGQPADAVVRYSEDFSQTGDVMLAHACRMGLEGVISKRIGAPYRSGRSFDWIKSKCIQRQEFIIVGYLASATSARGIQSILVAYHEKGQLKFGGRVGTGFTTKSGDSLIKKLGHLKSAKPAIAGLEREEKKGIWVRPKLVAEIEFRAWTEAGILRQASFKGLREDKPAAEIVKEVPVKAKEPKTKEPKTKSTTSNKVASKPETAVDLTNPAKLLWPRAKVSKQDLLDYYATVWPRMEQFIVDRPLSLLRAPDGIGGQLFFQKHASPGMHSAIRTLRDPADKQEHLYIRSFDGLAALVQLGVVEVHTWGAKIDNIERPDQIVFDLDPDEGLNSEAVRKAALDLKDHLEDLNIQPRLKTSGGKGFHVVVPLKPKARWEEVKTFAHDFAKAMVQAKPGKYTATLAKKARKGLIFIDYLRNGRGSTTVAPYSLRANADASISMPIEWQALKNGIDPKAYVIGSSETLKVLRHPDPWKNFFRHAKSIR